MINNTLTESEFKNVLENKLSVLLAQGDWTAKLDCGVKVLKYRNDSGLFMFLHESKVEVVASGHVVELTNPTLVNKISEMYYTLKTSQDAAHQLMKQQMVLETVDKLTETLQGYLYNRKLSE